VILEDCLSMGANTSPLRESNHKVLQQVVVLGTDVGDPIAGEAEVAVGIQTAGDSQHLGCASALEEDGEAAPPGFRVAGVRAEAADQAEVGAQGVARPASLLNRASMRLAGKNELKTRRQRRRLVRLLCGVRRTSGLADEVRCRPRAVVPTRPRYWTVTSGDVTAAAALDPLGQTLSAARIKQPLAEMKVHVKDKVRRFGLFSRLGEAWFFPKIEDAVSRHLQTHDLPRVDWEDRGKGTGA
jgi:hypothetical protein